jgi:hypothetical protein
MLPAIAARGAMQLLGKMGINPGDMAKKAMSMLPEAAQQATSAVQNMASRAGLPTMPGMQSKPKPPEEE